MVPSLSWLLPIPFYLLELLVGLVQALVLTADAVFTPLICQPAVRPRRLRATERSLLVELRDAVQAPREVGTL
jgi:hypothetical protein